MHKPGRTAPGQPKHNPFPPMIAVKIQCNCGQKYAFDVEPAGSFPSGSVTCPVCGADGTSAANSFIAQRITMPAKPSVQAAPTAAIRVATAAPQVATAVRMAPQMATPTAAAPSVAVSRAPAPAHAAPTRLPGQVDPERAVAEARSKIMWGDDVKQVTMFLRGNGFTAEDAAETIKHLIKERTATVRAEGARKIFKGIGYVLGAVIGVGVFLFIDFMPIYLLGVCVVAALYGLFTILKGIFMFVAPKAEGGDVADH